MPQLLQPTTARPSSLKISTLTVSFPHLGQEKNFGNRFLGIRMTFLLLRPIITSFCNVDYALSVFMLVLKYLPTTIEHEGCAVKMKLAPSVLELDLSEIEKRIRS